MHGDRCIGRCTCTWPVHSGGHSARCRLMLSTWCYCEREVAQCRRSRRSRCYCCRRGRSRRLSTVRWRSRRCRSDDSGGGDGGGGGHAGHRWRWRSRVTRQRGPLRVVILVLRGVRHERRFAVARAGGVRLAELSTSGRTHNTSPRGGLSRLVGVSVATSWCMARSRRGRTILGVGEGSQGLAAKSHWVWEGWSAAPHAQRRHSMPSLSPHGWLLPPPLLPRAYADPSRGPLRGLHTCPEVHMTGATYPARGLR
jgi:hypothetical protein